MQEDDAGYTEQPAHNASCGQEVVPGEEGPSNEDKNPSDQGNDSAYHE
jgi:hypothetical protein